MNIKTYKLKRLLDLSMIVGGLLFPLLWPLWIVVVLIIPFLIWLEDRGPIFYSQNRIRTKTGSSYLLESFWARSIPT